MKRPSPRCAVCPAMSACAESAMRIWSSTRSLGRHGAKEWRNNESTGGVLAGWNEFTRFRYVGLPFRFLLGVWQGPCRLKTHVPLFQTHFVSSKTGRYIVLYGNYLPSSQNSGGLIPPRLVCTNFEQCIPKFQSFSGLNNNNIVGKSAFSAFQMCNSCWGFARYR